MVSRIHALLLSLCAHRQTAQTQKTAVVGMLKTVALGGTLRPCKFGVNANNTTDRKSIPAFARPGSASLSRGRVHQRRRCSYMASASAFSAAADSSEPPFLRNLLAAIVKPYLDKNPTAVAAMDLIRAQDAGPICFDHFAFRTFRIDGCGIDSIAQAFLDMGYETCDELQFPAKKLRALWFSPPDRYLESKGTEFNGPLPRIFISELLVEKLSSDAQAVIAKYIRSGAQFSKNAAVVASVLNSLTWSTPSLGDYHILARESEYAAWTLVNGYALNHLTISVHRLSSDIREISRLNQLLQNNGIKLNSEGGVLKGLADFSKITVVKSIGCSEDHKTLIINIVFCPRLKVSPDGGLLQSSTVADSVLFHFSGDVNRTVPASYIEFAQRLVLPEYAGLPASEIREWHRRDGFEVGNADKIFESTSSDQTGVK